MLKGYRGPLLALVMSLLLLSLVLLARPTDQRPPSVATLATDPRPADAVTPVPVLPALTPAPTIPLRQIDTATLHEALSGCILKLNPLLAGYSQADRDVTALIFEGLMTTDQFGAAVPDLAAEPPRVSSDGLVYAIRLRRDVRWHDGLPFTSKDVVFTFALMQNPAFPGPADLRAFWQTVEVDAIDEQSVRFRLAQPLATFPDHLRLGILPEHALRGVSGAQLTSHPFNLTPIGTGPYQFDGLIGDGAALTGLRLRFAATYRDRPEGKDGFAFRQIVFHCQPSFSDAVAAFQRGQVNTLAEVPPDAVPQIASLGLNVSAAFRPALGTVIYNWQRDSVAFFRDSRMRQALARSIDRTALVRRSLPNRAIPADSPILPNSWAYTPGNPCPAYDPAQPNAAKDRLAQVQIAPTAEATQAATAQPQPGVAHAEFRFQLLTSNDPALAALGESMINAWKDLGLRASLVVVDRATFRDRLIGGDFDAALVELNLAPAADPDPYSLWRQRPAEGGLNFGGMDDRRLSELMESARRAFNSADRMQRYQEFQRLFCDRAAALILYYPVYYYGTDRRLEGVQLGFLADPSDRFRTIRDWRFVDE